MRTGRLLNELRRLRDLAAERAEQPRSLEYRWSHNAKAEAFSRAITLLERELKRDRRNNPELEAVR